MDPKRVVAAGYDAMAERYLVWSDLQPSATRLQYLALSQDLIPIGADVLDLGCGAGIPMSATLATGRSLTGVDISAVQIALARANVPSATFVQADMTTLDFPPGSFDAVVAFYSLTHVPRAEHAALFGRIRTWLRPGGLFLASLGVEDSPDEIEADWLGVDMFFSHFSARVNRRLIAEAGLSVERAVVVAEPEDRHDARFLWVVATAPSPESPK
jgi:SAM-dependent methyltransferase